MNHTVKLTVNKLKLNIFINNIYKVLTMVHLFYKIHILSKNFLALFLFLILFVIFYNSNVEAACPTGNGNGQTINILSSDNCTSRISNPGTSVTVAGNLTVNSGDGAIFQPGKSGKFFQ